MKKYYLTVAALLIVCVAGVLFVYRDAGNTRPQADEASQSSDQPAAAPAPKQDDGMSGFGK